MNTQYQVGDLIQYGRTGVCRVEEISGEEHSRYYRLKPLYQNCSIRVGVDNEKVFMRPIISRLEAEQLIRQIPEITAEPCRERNLNRLREYYRTRIERHACEDLIALTKSLYLKKKEAEAQRRKFGAVDERYMREAEDLLYGEFAAALEIDRDSVENYIAKSLNRE